MTIYNVFGIYTRRHKTLAGVRFRKKPKFEYFLFLGLYGDILAVTQKQRSFDFDAVHSAISCGSDEAAMRRLAASGANYFDKWRFKAHPTCGPWLTSDTPARRLTDVLRLSSTNRLDFVRIHIIASKIATTRFVFACKKLPHRPTATDFHNSGPTN